MRSTSPSQMELPVSGLLLGTGRDSMEGNSGLFAECPMLGCVPILAQGVVVESKLINENPSAPEPPSKLRMEQMFVTPDGALWCLNYLSLSCGPQTQTKLTKTWNHTLKFPFHDSETFTAVHLTSMRKCAYGVNRHPAPSPGSPAPPAPRPT